ncbi:MAG: 1-(5-phosphoribosyl)-5-[(5-phosphoribosylamino)methylideneamino]imidazole-4-carboxamide isomerase [Kofleriaceae bacterium]|nr:1-(5-phosphoribosyl)-5-[(5-phosphoribosylamino)methylideneamino]imidazole-4-carboxamide isomerase [Kofleriaceae bacterium]MCL4224112.1 1-(5-phosphoribosyl)-5-[(5-phosphoribosylamino)methylideneamino]imidazole-4-carboxamide isomerase [Myxococcales bacterium]
MKLYPAIDLLGGRAVRLREGRRDQATVYRDHPEELVAELVVAGVERLHVVDLDGAFAGARAHGDVIARLCAAAPVPVQVGGGIRDAATARAVLAAGAGRVVLGTAAVKQPAMVEALCRELPGRVVVAVDAKDGLVAVEGWVETSTVSARELAERAAAWGAAAILYTDVARDGTGAGPNVAATAALAAAVSIEVIASGGVHALDDLRALAAAGVPACVVGRALYDGRFTVAEAVEAARC